MPIRQIDPMSLWPTFPANANRFVRIADVCDFLSVDRHTVRKMIECDVLPAFKLPNGHYRVSGLAVAAMSDCQAQGEPKG